MKYGMVSKPKDISRSRICLKAGKYYSALVRKVYDKIVEITQVFCFYMTINTNLVQLTRHSRIITTFLNWKKIANQEARA